MTKQTLDPEAEKRFNIAVSKCARKSCGGVFHYKYLKDLLIKEKQLSRDEERERIVDLVKTIKEKYSIGDPFSENLYQLVMAQLKGTT